MTPLTRMCTIAVPLMEDNVDTDMIYPARFLLQLSREGQGAYAFHDRRHDVQGRKIPGFVLDEPRFADAEVLLGGANFGSGSSREQAVWCLADLGIRSVIAVSMGDIFANNCVNNGVLPIVLERAHVEALAVAARAGRRIAVDLVDQTVGAEGETPISFEIAGNAREMLLNGWDPTGRILAEQREAIADYEALRNATRGWSRISA